MNSGKQFENDFKDSIPNEIYWIRLKDPAQSFGDNTNLRFSLPNPYDYLMYIDNLLFVLELKSNQSTSFSIQHTKEEKGKDIKLHQIEGLTEASKFPGVYAGLVLNFRKTCNTYWLDIKKFNEFNNETDKKSINEEDAKKFDGVLIESQIKKVRYKYFIGKLIEKISNKTVDG
jgi:penicillin-binding protein-related factor A (putative recombinase)